MDLEECLLITDATLTHLAMGCPRLEKLVSNDSIYIGVRLDTRQNVFSVRAFVLSEERYRGNFDNVLMYFVVSTHRVCRIAS